MARYASGKKALGICDRCGFQYKLRQLKEEVVAGNLSGLLTCPECWDSDHPQNDLGKYPVHDPQALRNPRPDAGERIASRELIVQAPSFQITMYTGDIIVTTS